jgi:hypothetical protein
MSPSHTLSRNLCYKPTQQYRKTKISTGLRQKLETSHCKINFLQKNIIAIYLIIIYNILHEIRKRKANWIGHILRRNCLLKQVIEGKIQGRIEVTGRQGRRRRKLLVDLKERRGYSHLREEALDRTMWGARFGRGFGPVLRHTTN